MANHFPMGLATYLLVGRCDAEPVSAHDAVHIVNGICVPFSLKMGMVEGYRTAEDGNSAYGINNSQVWNTSPSPCQVDDGNRG